MSEANIPTPFSQLVRNPESATPREQLQAVVAILLGRYDRRASAILGLDPWYWEMVGDEQMERARLRALRRLLEWFVDGSGEVAQHVVDLLREEVPPLLKALDQEAQQARPTVGANRFCPGLVPGLRLFAEGVVVGIERHEGVVDALTRVEPSVLVGKLAANLFCIRHGEASSLGCGGEKPQRSEDGLPAATQAVAGGPNAQGAVV